MSVYALTFFGGPNSQLLLGMVAWFLRSRTRNISQEGLFWEPAGR